MDRDVHAAKNMVWFYENNVGVERTKVKRMEMKALVNQIISNQENQLLSAKYEDSSLQAGISSLCYEKPGDFCHRHLVADWLTKSGVNCIEWT